MPPKKDLTGQQFGKWKVLRRLPGYPVRYVCQCECGRKCKVLHGNLQSKRSSGCTNCAARGRRRTHGMSHTPTYYHWRTYKHKYPEEWQSFKAFFRDVGEKPSGRVTLVPKDPSKPLSKNNFCWSKVQGGIFIEFNGEILNISGWARRFGVTRERMRQRLEKYPLEIALYGGNQKWTAMSSRT